MKKIFLIVFVLLSCQNFYGAADSEGQFLTDRASFEKSAQYRNAVVQSREIYEQYKNYASDYDQGEYLLGLKNKREARENVAEMLGVNVVDLKEQDSRIRKLPLKAHSDKGGLKNLSEEQKNLFLIALKQLYNNYEIDKSIINLPEGLDSASFTTDTLYQKGPNQNVSFEVRIDNIAKYIIEQTVLAQSTVTKTIDPEEALQKVALNFDPWFFKVDHSSSKIATVLTGMENLQSLSSDDLQDFGAGLRGLEAMCGDFMNDYLGNLIVDNNFKPVRKALFEKFQQYLNNIIACINSILSLVKRCEDLQKQFSSSTSSSSDKSAQKETELEAKMRAMARTTNKADNAFDEAGIPSTNGSLRSTKEIFKDAIEVVIPNRHALDEGSLASLSKAEIDQQKKDNLLLFQKKIKFFKDNIDRLQTVVDGNSAFAPCRDTFNQWVIAYKVFIDYCAQNVYGLPPVFFAPASSTPPSPPKGRAPQAVSQELMRLQDTLMVLAF